MNKKIFISGPITGVSGYRDNFSIAEDYLNQKGYVVVNPAYLPEGLGTHDDYMDICYKMLDKCDAIYMLHGWKNSKGANMEGIRAFHSGKEIIYQDLDPEFTLYEGDQQKVIEVLADSFTWDYNKVAAAASSGLAELMFQINYKEFNREKLIEEIVSSQVIFQLLLNSLRADQDTVNRAYMHDLLDLEKNLRR